MVHKCCTGTPFCDCSLRGVICIVDIEVWDCSNCNIRKTPVRWSSGFSGQELKISMSSHMDDNISTKHPFKPSVSRKVLVCRGNLRIVEDPACLTITPRAGTSPLWLDADDRITIGYSGDNDFTIMHHRCRNTVHLFSRRPAP